MSALTCDMLADCAAPVTHIGEKGYAYCEPHALQRRTSRMERTRKMRGWEKSLLEDGKQLPSYAPTRKPRPTLDAGSSRGQVGDSIEALNSTAYVTAGNILTIVRKPQPYFTVAVDLDGVEHMMLPGDYRVLEVEE